MLDLLYFLYYYNYEVIRLASKDLLYQQIKLYLLDTIRENESAPNYRLPSENQLCIKFQASRVAVRHALQELEDDGLVTRQQGRGTFIRQQQKKREENHPQKNIVALLVPSLDSLYVQRIMRSAQVYLAEQSIHLAVFETLDDAHLEENLIRTVIQMNAKGLMIMPVSFSRYSNEMLRLALNRFPTVQIDRSLPGLHLSVVSCDHFRSAYNATRYLQEKGHKIIGLVSQTMDFCSSVSQRLAGYERAMYEADMLYNNRIRFTKNIAEPDFKEMFEKFLVGVKPTALICSAKYYGAHIAQVFEKLHLRMMQDITVMIYDTEYQDMLAYGKNCPIIIDQQPEKIGELASKEIMRLISGDSADKDILIPEIIHTPEAP